MNTIASIVESVYRLLSEDAGLRDISFVRAYPGGFKRSPMTECTVTTGLLAAELSPGGFADYCGEDDETGGERYFRRAAVKIRLELFAPLDKTGMSCAGLFTRISDCLLAGALSGALAGIEAGETIWDRQAGAYMLPVTLKLAAMLSCGAADETVFDEIIVKTKDVR